ncbi:hypothetical protein VSP18_01145 [Klebsiella pneumoniae]|uniref:hypothetical protein n=1 Tax=Klebsiella pneumoniae TaxID=573 RepID=UPI002DB69DD7|nr:hypothetical protein [Klebsiella pneumoniae]MEC4009632.1 hypothetical protein [Klebsiella pneumoniae]
MTRINETPKWEGDIYQISRQDKVAGGKDGVANKQAGQLANRTLYLKEALDDLSDAVYSGSDIYETKEAGLLKTSEGEYFKVPVSGISDISYILYQNKSGVAVEILREKSPYSSGYQAATVVSSSAANTVAITIPGLLGDGSLIYFLSPILNTGAVNITVTDAKGAVVTRAIQKQNFAALVGNELLLNQPVLMEFRTGSANNFVLVASGPVAAELNARLLSLELNSLTIVSSVAASADAYTGATANTTSSQVLVTGRAFVFTPSATNTTRAPTLSLNGWTARTIKQAGGTALAVGDLVSGNPCFLMYNAASSDFRLLTYPGDRARILSAYVKGTVTSDSISPNAISLTIPGLLGDGTQITFEPVVANTGATTLLITDLYGNSVTRNLLKGANTALTGGELQAAKPVTVQYRSSPVNNFKLLLSGDPTTEILNLKSSVTTLQGAITDPYTKLSKKLIGDGTQANTAPFGKISFSNGVRTVTKKRIIITTPGSSIGRGAGSTGGGGVGAPFSPSALFIEAMKSHLAGYGEFEFIDDNQSIGGQAIHQFAAQLQNSPYFTSSDPEDWPDIVLIVGGMNDATPTGNFNRGRTYPLQRAVLEDLIDQCTAKGAVVIVCTTPHHNVESTTVKNIRLGDLNVLWPVRTFNVTTNYSFDSANKTINSTAFAYDTGNAASSWGGQILRVGHILRVNGGDNTGDYTITAISEDRQTITVAENIPASGSIYTTIQHINLDSIIEEVLDPPPSKSFVEANWSGSGVKVVGDARFGLYNSMVRTVARGKSAFVMENEIPWFRLGVEVHGWSALFTSPNYNHPNDLGYTVSYKAGADAAAFSLCKLIYGEKYYRTS